MESSGLQSWSVNLRYGFIYLLFVPPDFIDIIELFSENSFPEELPSYRLLTFNVTNFFLIKKNSLLEWRCVNL